MSTMPARVDLRAYYNDSFEQVFIFNPAPPTGAVVTAEARAFSGSAAFAFGSTLDAAGKLTLTLPDPQPKLGTYHYDVQVEAAGNTKTWIRGKIVIVGDVSV